MPVRNAPEACAPRNSSTSFWLELFSPAVSGVEVVPVLDIILALLPTKKNFLAADEGREIEQSTVEIFDLNFADGKTLEQVAAFRKPPHRSIYERAAQII